ncbi:MAG: ATP-binding protein [Lutimaribacter sp.]
MVRNISNLAIRGNRRFWPLAGAVLALLAAILYFAADVRGQISQLSKDPNDNVQWVLSQPEIELLTLATLAGEGAQDPTGALTAIRQRFDVFYSRVALLDESPIYAELRADPEVARNLGQLRSYLNATAPLIDGPDTALRAALTDVQQSALEHRLFARNIALAGLRLFSRKSDQQRQDVYNTLVGIAILTTVLVLILVLLVAVLSRLAAKSRADAQEIAQTRDRMQKIIETSLDAVILSDPNGRIIEYNGAAERVFGYTRAEAINGDMAQMIIPKHLRQQHQIGMQRYLSGKRSCVIGQGVLNLTAMHKSGREFPVEMVLDLAKTAEGEGFIGLIRDISERMSAQAELTQARDRAVAGEKSKAELLAVMSHEMRTPLNGILGTLELINPDATDAETDRYLQVIRKSSHILLTHINDVLDVSRLDAGKMPMLMRPFDLAALLHEIADNQSGRAREHGNILVVNTPPSGMGSVYSDPDRLRQVLLNLVSNAIKFTRNGQVTIEAETGPDAAYVDIRVIDTGIGIEEDDLDRIFEDFETIDTSYGRASEGTGLGLGIAKRLTLALGGHLDAVSEPGQGSVFWVRLPLSAHEPAEDAEETPPASSPAPSFAQPSLRVLVVEDNAVNRMVAREMLERDGHSVFEANDGRAGIDMAQGEKFDVILMDISMPEIDGMAATRAIRAGTGPNAQTPIVAATAHALPSEAHRFFDAGMEYVVTKPLTRETLRQTLANALAGTAMAPPGADTTPGGDVPILDMAELGMLVQDMPSPALAKAVKMFRAEMAEFVNGPLKHHTQRETLAFEAHRMAGSAGIFSAKRLNALLSWLELRAPAADSTELQTLAQQIHSCWQITDKAIADCDALHRVVDKDHS